MMVQLEPLTEQWIMEIMPRQSDFAQDTHTHTHTEILLASRILHTEIIL